MKMRQNLRIARYLSDPVVLIECFIISNLAFLAVDIYVAHSMNGFAHWAEWIPFVFSLAAPLLIIAAYALAGDIRPRPTRSGIDRSVAELTSHRLGMLVGYCSIAVGIAGLLWHLNSQFFEQQTLRNLVYAAPFVAPLAYSGIGFLILLNRMVDHESTEWARWILVLALGGWVGNFVLSLTDHAQNAFFYWYEWVPVVSSAIAIGALVVAVTDFRNRVFLRICMFLMALQVIVGVVGWILHLIAVAKSPMDTTWERIVFSAPVFAPLLFANLAILALIGLATLNGSLRPPLRSIDGLRAAAAQQTL
jgi:hypothetical protein